MSLKTKKAMAKRLISCIYSFILTLIFVVLFICSGIGIGLLNRQGVIRNLDKSNYYREVYEALYDRASRDIEAAGFPASVLEEAITLERVYITGKGYHNAILNTEATPLKTEKLKETLDRNLRQYLMAKGVEPDQLTSSLENLLQTIEQDYKDAIDLPILITIAAYRSNYVKGLLYGMPIMILLVGSLCYLLLRIYRNSYIHRGIRYITYALMSASILISSMAGYLLITKPYLGISAQPAYYHSFLIEYLHWSIVIFVYIGGMGFVLSLILMSLVSYLKNRMKNN